MRRLIAGIAALLSTSGAVASQGQPIGLKEISYRSGLVTFSVPMSWTEEYEPEGGGVFYGPGDNTGTLRLNVISARPPTADVSLTSKQVLSHIGHPKSENLPNGSAVSKSISRDTDGGTPITIYWWYLANVLSPEHVRIANFSYTILSSEEHSPVIALELATLENSIRNARFSLVVGNELSQPSAPADALQRALPASARR
jgi:hypothetical protein